MKLEKNFKQVIILPIMTLIGILVGIVLADLLEANIGMGIALGWSHGFFIGAVFMFIKSRIGKK